MALKIYDPGEEDAGDAGALAGDLSDTVSEAASATIRAAGRAVGKAAREGQQKAVSAIKQGFKKLLKKFGLTWGLSWIFGFLPANIILVWRTLKGNIMSPEGILMFPIAVFADGTIGILYFIELFFDLGVISTLTKWAINAFFAAWIWVRGSKMLGLKQDEKQPETADTTKEQATKPGPKPQQKAAPKPALKKAA